MVITSSKRAALLGLVLAGCGGKVVDGDGRLSTETRSPADFNRVKIEASVAADVLIGPKSVLLLLDENLKALVTTNVEGDTLVVKTPDGVDVRPTAGARATITLPQLDGIEVSGTAVATAQLNGPHAVLIASGDSSLTANTAVADSVSIENSGDGKVTVSGTTPSQTIDASGSGTTDSTVTAKTTTVHASGAVKVSLKTTDKVTGEASGASAVTVNGQPPERSVVTSGTATVTFSP